MRSDYARALEQFEQALELWLDISGVVAFDTCITLGHILGNLGRMSEALAHFARAEELSRLNGQEFRYRQKPTGEGWVLRELGAVDAAIELDRSAVARAREAGARFSELSHGIDLAQDYLFAGDIASAVLALSRARELLSDPELGALPYDVHGATLRYLVAESLTGLAQKRFELAGASAAELLRASARYDSAKYAASAHWLLALVSRAEGQPLRAEQQLNDALSLLVERPAPLLAWQLHAELAELELARGARDAAARSRAAARAIVSAIAASIERAELRQAFSSSPRVRAVLRFDAALPAAG
jgi:tetratricopeptide (TPR) repeat protein